MHNGDPLLCMLGAVKNIETNKRKKSRQSVFETLCKYDVRRTHENKRIVVVEGAIV